MNIVSRTIEKARNYVLSERKNKTAPNSPSIPYTDRDAKLPGYYIMPLQLQRIAQDLSSWRDAISKAENAWYPTRYYMQRLFVDTILDGHILACMNKRKRLTLQKEFKIGKKTKEGIWEENEEYTALFKNKRWFRDMLSYLLDKKFYGYSLIQLGDLIEKGTDKDFVRLINLRRWNVEPDRQNLVSIPLERTGINFLDPTVKDPNGIPYYDWSIYVDTPTDIGHSICGYGLLYQVAIYAIILRSNLSRNADYTELFGSPYRHITTDKKFNSDEFKQLQKSAKEMGSGGFIITTQEEKINFVQGNSGEGYKSFADLEKRCEAKISKIILGHSDILDPTAGKLGSQQGGGNVETPQTEATSEVEKEDTEDLLNDLNDVVLPKLRNIGFNIPLDFCFYVPNDKEAFETRKQEDLANLQTATIAQTMKNAGLSMGAEYFQERTGIPTTEAPLPTPPAFGEKVQARLKQIYK